MNNFRFAMIRVKKIWQAFGLERHKLLYFVTPWDQVGTPFKDLNRERERKKDRTPSRQQSVCTSPPFLCVQLSTFVLCVCTLYVVCLYHMLFISWNLLSYVFGTGVFQDEHACKNIYPVHLLVHVVTKDKALCLCVYMQYTSLGVSLFTLLFTLYCNSLVTT